MDSVIKLEEANQVIALQAPKVELYDTLTHQDEDTRNFMTLVEVAKELDVYYHKLIHIIQILSFSWIEY